MTKRSLDELDIPAGDRPFISFMEDGAVATFDVICGCGGINAVYSGFCPCCWKHLSPVEREEATIKQIPLQIKRAKLRMVHLKIKENEEALTKDETQDIRTICLEKAKTFLQERKPEGKCYPLAVSSDYRGREEDLYFVQNAETEEARNWIKGEAFHADGCPDVRTQLWTCGIVEGTLNFNHDHDLVNLQKLQKMKDHITNELKDIVSVSNIKSPLYGFYVCISDNSHIFQANEDSLSIIKKVCGNAEVYEGWKLEKATGECLFGSHWNVESVNDEGTEKLDTSLDSVSKYIKDHAVTGSIFNCYVSSATGSSIGPVIIGARLSNGDMFGVRSFAAS